MRINNWHQLESVRLFFNRPYHHYADRFRFIAINFDLFEQTRLAPSLEIIGPRQYPIQILLKSEMGFFRIGRDESRNEPNSCP